ncbi:MAG TPA: hypothetical protein VM939_02685 [Gemmatimonadaceae bacterium]|nr:hypothetical protein [Gemmatimonadaceae bacterium]
MRRSLMKSCLGTIALAVSQIAFANVAAAQGVLPSTDTVMVDIRCLPGNGVSFSLAPWTVQLRQGETVDWVLHPDAGVSEISITPKQPAWPFQETGPYRGNAANGPKARNMRAAQAIGARFGYNVNASCTRADGSTSRIIIDPDMIIVR